MREKILALLRENDGFVSGQDISESLGVSRTSVWKYMRTLTEEGYEIEAVTHRGYRLISEPDLLTAGTVTDCLNTQWAGSSIISLPSVDSTNNEAKRRAEEGAPHGLLILAEEQTGGRGRRGRVWASEKGDGIYLSLLLRPDMDPDRASMLTLVMGLAAREALNEACGLDAMIKWPNDIVADGKKLCGILTEMSAEMSCINHIVIGVGINVRQSSFPEEIRPLATSVFLETGRRIPRAGIVAECLARFEEYYDIFMRTKDMSGLVDVYNAALINRGRQVRVTAGAGDFTGTARGINERGELLVETEGGLRSVMAGEVSVRGVYAYV